MPRYYTTTILFARSHEASRPRSPSLVYIHAQSFVVIRFRTTPTTSHNSITPHASWGR